MAIDRRYNGCRLTNADLVPALAAENSAATTPASPPPVALPPGDHLWIAAGEPVPETAVHRGPRIGVEYAGEDARLPYRLSVHGHPHLSRPA